MKFGAASWTNVSAFGAGGAAIHLLELASVRVLDSTFEGLTPLQGGGVASELRHTDIHGAGRLSSVSDLTLVGTRATGLGFDGAILGATAIARSYYSDWSGASPARGWAFHPYAVGVVTSVDDHLRGVGELTSRLFGGAVLATDLDVTAGASAGVSAPFLVERRGVLALVGGAIRGAQGTAIAVRDGFARVILRETEIAPVAPAASGLPGLAVACEGSASLDIRGLTALGVSGSALWLQTCTARLERLAAALHRPAPLVLGGPEFAAAVLAYDSAIASDGSVEVTGPGTSVAIASTCRFEPLVIGGDVLGARTDLPVPRGPIPWPEPTPP